MKVQEVMTSDPQYLHADATLQEAARMMRECNCGMLPIAGEDRLLGIVTDHDIVVRGLAEGYGPDQKASGCMTDRVLYCCQDDDVADVARNMESQHVQRLIVLDNRESKRLCGVISMSDIAAACAGDDSMQGAISDCSRPYGQDQQAMH